MQRFGLGGGPRDDRQLHTRVELAEQAGKNRLVPNVAIAVGAENQDWFGEVDEEGCGAHGGAGEAPRKRTA